MRILFLNQYFPPDPAPTGILFREIADECVRRGHEVDFVDSGQDYRAGQAKGGRMRRELAALRRMVGAGKARPRADVVVSGSSPPCLAVFADRVARKHRARHLHWAMDVYPEIAVALGEINQCSLIARLTFWMMGRAYRRCAAVVALDADMAEVFARHRVKPICIRPWIFQPIMDQMRASEWAPRLGSVTWTWLYSGNLGRAHEFETILQAQKALEQRGVDVRLVFQGGGPSWEKAQKRAGELSLLRCVFRNYAPAADLIGSLLESDALVVSQRPETKGMLWPSKLGLASALPRPLLFIGPVDGAIASELRALDRAGVFAPGDVAGVVEWVLGQRSVSTEMATVSDPAMARKHAIAAWIAEIEAPITFRRCKTAG